MSEIDKLSTGDPKVFEIFRSIAKWFDSIYYIDLVDGSFDSMIQAGGRALLNLPEDGDYARMIGHLAATVVYPGDRDLYIRMLDMEHIVNHLRSHECQEFEYRSIMPDGTYHWYLNMIVILSKDTDGTPLKAASLVRDVHDKKTEALAAERRQKAVERALSEEHRRIEMLAEATNAVVIYYDIQRKTARMLMNERRKKDTNRLVEILYTDIGREWRAIIHPDDFDRFLSLFVDGRGLEEAYSIRARLRYDTSYRWYRVTGRAVCDNARRPLRIVATLKDIHKEKQEEMKLLQKTELDAATGVLNRAALEMRVTQLLLKGCKNQMGVFMIMDLDQFKRINDCYGHIEGDRVICEFAAVLKSLFRSTDVIGRMGGDEFAVFFHGLFTNEQIGARARKICQQVKLIMEGAGNLPGSSCSIGISVCENGEKPFKQLYKEADTALYQQKKHGRDGYRFYALEK